MECEENAFKFFLQTGQRGKGMFKPFNILLHQRRLLYRCYSLSANAQEFLSINPFESIVNNKSLEIHHLNKLQGLVDSGIQENLKKVLETRAKIAQSKKLHFDIGKPWSHDHSW